MTATLRLGRIFGIPIEINITWLIIFLLLTWLLANRFDSPSLRWPVAQQWTVAVITAALFFLSILAHELSHSLVALNRGIPVSSITLFLFGGVSRLDHEPQRPAEEFLIAIVGPTTSIALAIAAAALLLALNSGQWPWHARNLSPIQMTALLLAWGNLSVGIFNLIPGFPLDGGRILRALLWALTGSHLRATRIAARIGQIIALLLILAGILWALLNILIYGVWDSIINGVWASIIGAFLLITATAAYPRPQNSPPEREQIPPIC